MKESAKKHLKFVLRWGVAAVGVWYVLSQLSWHDRVLAVFDSGKPPQWASVLRGGENTDKLEVRLWNTGDVRVIDQGAVVSEPDKKKMTVVVNGTPRPLLGVDLESRDRARRLLVGAGPDKAEWAPANAVPGYQVAIPHPHVQIGVEHLVASALQQKPYFLWAAIGIFPLTFIITAFRWHELLEALDIRMTTSRTFVLNMVGAFYNTFMPGSTGGDVLKAYYVAKQTHHRTRAVMSVVVDRVIGLLALIILGGTMAAFAAVHWHVRQTVGIALGSLAIVAGTALGLVVFYSEFLRRATGLDWVIRRLPMQRQVENAIETMHLYGKRPGLALGALIASFPVHGVVVLSALFAGKAFALHIPWYYYWTVVPVAVLAGSIPISPQGAGVMEYFAIKLLEPMGCTVAEAVALTMSIRLVQILWNLTGGLFVLRGGYHAPTRAEERQVEAEDEDQPHGEAATPAPSGASA